MYHIVTETSSPLTQLPKHSNLVNFSVFRELYSPSPFRSFSIKYVMEGCEKYTVNGTKYHIESAQYLLANHFSEGFIEIESHKAVKGLCIDVAPDILSEVVATFRAADTPIADLSLDSFFNTPDFFENQYHASHTHLGQFLQSLAPQVASDLDLPLQFTNAFYFTVAEKIILDHIPIYKQLQNVRSVKMNTKKDLLRRVGKGKQFIEEHFLLPIEVKNIAYETTLSEYHFFRLFKNIYGVSPYQYLLQKRLEYATHRLKEKEMTITDIAFQTGFADVAAFSKAFKKQFGYCPSSARIAL